jgi:hypothetical protein
MMEEVNRIYIVSTNVNITMYPPVQILYANLKSGVGGGTVQMVEHLPGKLGSPEFKPSIPINSTTLFHY